MPEIEIHLLGRFFVIVQGQELEEARWTRKKAKSLVKLLAVSPQRRIHRERAAEVLWPEMELEAAVANLHKAIHAARRALEPNLRQGAASRFLFSQEAQISLAAAPELSIDGELFEQQAAAALKSKDLRAGQEALALYQGDLLMEDLYEDFCSIPREHARSMCERLLEQISQQQEALADPARNESLERLLQLNPVNEDARRRLMRFHLQTGQRHLALDQYRQCCEALKLELDAEPERETKALFEQILSGEAGLRLQPLPTVSVIPPMAQASPQIEGPVTITPVPLPARRRIFWALGGFAGVAAMGLLWRSEKTVPNISPALARSLAILPIRSSGGSQDEKILAEGITEGLINSASRLPKLRVMARATVFTYQDRSDALAIARELKVTQVLNGQLQKEGNSYRVSLELVDVSDGARLWGRQFFSKIAEVHTLQQSLNSEVAAILEPARETGPNNAASTQRIPNPGAYQLYLNGRFFANQRSAVGLEKARTYFEQAIALDPDYALAHAGLADSLGLLGVNVANPRDLMPRAKSAAERAITLEESLAEAHTSLGMVYALYEWNWPKAEQEFRRATALNEGYATAHHWYGVNLAGQGRFREAEQELTKALDLDPLSPIIQLNRGYPLYYQQRYADALVFYRKALELKPDFQTALEDRATLEHMLGQEAAAASTIISLLGINGEKPLQAAFAQTYKSNGYAAALRALLSGYEARAQSAFVSPMKIASVAQRAGERQKTYFWLEKAFQQRAALLIYIGVDPLYGSLRSEPGFRNLVQRIGLLAY